MDVGQSRLPLPSAPRANRNHDYVDLFPHGIFPSGDIDLLERGRNILIIKSYEHSKLLKMSDAQRRIWLLLSASTGYSCPEAPGSITVVCVEGLGLTLRKWIVFDHQGEHGIREGLTDSWRSWLLSWSSAHKRRR